MTKPASDVGKGDLYDRIVLRRRLRRASSIPATGGIFLFGQSRCQGVRRDMPPSYPVGGGAWQKTTGAQLEILPKPKDVFQTTSPAIPHPTTKTTKNN